MSDYTTRLEAALAAGHIRRDEAVHVEVEHRLGCKIWRTNVCTCHPILRVLRDGEVLMIGADGHVLERRRKA